MINATKTTPKPNGIKYTDVLNEEIQKWIRVKIKKAENEYLTIKRLKAAFSDVC